MDWRHGLGLEDSTSIGPSAEDSRAVRRSII